MNNNKYLINLKYDRQKEAKQKKNYANSKRVDLNSTY